MRDEARARREEQIAKAAYELIEEKGYSGTSMLAIARKARASNETLYNWYGDKQGLFKALISRNTDDVRKLLDPTDAPGVAPLQRLQALGPKLLKMLLGDRAIALNRAAAADPSGQLGQTLSGAGRAAILPLIGKVLDDAQSTGHVAFDSLDDALNTYISLLVGDLQIRRAIGALEQPGDGAIALRAKTATLQFLALYSPRAAPSGVIGEPDD